MSSISRQQSEDVIINAPMSFAGAAQRVWRIRRNMLGTDSNVVLGFAGTLPLVVLLLAWWAFIAVWYLVFSVLLIPYRLLRRGARKRRAEALRHRELMAALDAQKSAPPQPEG